jgi:hypothetical protein
MDTIHLSGLVFARTWNAQQFPPAQDWGMIPSDK